MSVKRRTVAGAYAVERFPQWDDFDFSTEKHSATIRHNVVLDSCFTIMIASVRF